MTSPATDDAASGRRHHMALGIRRLFGRGFVYSVSDASTALAGLLVVPLYTRHLSTADYGVLGTLAAARQFLTPVIGLGLVSSLRGMYHAGDDEDRARALPTVVNAALLYSVAVSAVLTFGGWVYLAAQGERLPYGPHLLLTIWTVFAVGFYFVPLTVFVLDHRPGRYAAYNFVTSGVVVAANVLFVVVLDGGLIGALVANLIGGFVGLGLGALAIRERYRPIIDRGQLRIALRIALPTLPHALASAAWRFSDRFFLTTLATLSQAGVYTLAATIASVIPLGLGGLSTAFGAEFYRRSAARDDGFPEEWSRLFVVYVATAVWVGLAFAAFARPMVDVLGTTTFADAADVIPILALGQTAIAIGWLFAPAVETEHQTSAYTKATLPALALNMVLNFTFVPMWGARGAALAFALTAAFQVALFGRFSWRAYRFPVATSPMVVSGVVAVGLFLVTRPIAGAINPVPALAVNALVVGGLYPVALVASRVISPEEIRRLLSRPLARGVPGPADLPE